MTLEEEGVLLIELNWVVQISINLTELSLMKK